MHAAIAVGGACELMVTITISMYRAESRGFRGVGEWFCENLGLNYRVKESGGEYLKDFFDIMLKNSFSLFYTT